MARNYVWPFDIFGFCWRQGRLYYLAVDNIGFIFLLTSVKPIFIGAFDVSNPLRQVLLDPRTIAQHLRRQVMQAARQALAIAHRTPGFIAMPIPRDLPAAFPVILPLVSERRRFIQLYLGYQSDFEH